MMENSQSDLFGSSKKAPAENAKTARPLADRLRPERLEEFFGQEHLVGPNSPLRRAIEKDAVASMIFWGPPGTGKTTLAKIIAAHTEREFTALSAVMAGVKDIKEAVATAQYQQRTFNRRTILFVDEIHRFNKAQQDALLPFVEDGTVTLIGATTENPSFELNSALLSRAPIFILKQLDAEALMQILKRATRDAKGLNASTEPPEALFQQIAARANGDGRRALGILDDFFSYAVKSGLLKAAGPLTAELALEWLEKSTGKKTLRYDATGEEHYNTISAFIKSMRDSDPDAALYYLARMLESGEEPLFIARRMVIFASEDIGNAEPRALQVALATKDAVDFVGMPEARINLGHGVAFLASCPKSNAAYMGIEQALADVREHGNLEIPLHIRNAPTKFMKGIGYGKGYRYAHDYESAITGQTNLPDALKNKIYYEPKNAGLEKAIAERLEQIRKVRKAKD